MVLNIDSRIMIPADRVASLLGEINQAFERHGFLPANPPAGRDEEEAATIPLTKDFRWSRN